MTSIGEPESEFGTRMLAESEDPVGLSDKAIAQDKSVSTYAHNLRWLHRADRSRVRAAAVG
jgi:hypothetical protein